MSEETSSPNNAWLVLGAAFVIVVLAIGAYVFFNQKPPVHSGEVLSLNVYPIHRELHSGPTTEGLPGETETYDEMLVLADVRIKNQTDIPLFLHDMWGTLDLADEKQTSTAASPTDFTKVFVAYPALAVWKKDPLNRDLTLSPGQQVEGMMVFHYQVSKAQWDARNSFNINVSFLHQKSLVLQTAK